nr:E3 ubiquitin protein ligase MARCH5 [Hymenolepis microstoma]
MQSRWHARTSSSGERMCWICYSIEREDRPEQQWIHPCRCRGSSKWVHLGCLQRWLDEKQRSDPSVPVACRICGYEYVIEYPPAGPLLVALTSVDAALDASSSYVFAGAILGSLYWTAATFGAITVIQICGQDAGLAVMERADSMTLIIGLPAIPIGLIAVHLFDWQSWLLKIWRNHAYKIPLVQYFLPKDVCLARLEETGDLNTSLTVTRVLCNSLALPTFAVFFGRFLFGHVHSRVFRALAGGLFYTGFTGFLQMYQREMNFLRRCRRRIKEYQEDGEEGEDHKG